MVQQSVENAVNLYFRNLHILRPILTPRKLISSTAEWPPMASMTGVPDELERGNWNYCRPNMAMGNSNGTDNGHLKDVNMMFQ